MPPHEKKAPEIKTEEWINSEVSSLNQGIYLLDFWSYSCKHCIEMIEWNNKIHRKHPEIQVIGIHIPEFEFEKSKQNLEKAVNRHGIEYPIALDNEKEAAKKYGSNYWKGQTLIQDGQIKLDEKGNNTHQDLRQEIEQILEIDKIEKPSYEKEKQGRTSQNLGFKHCKGVNQQGNFKGLKNFSQPSNIQPDQVYVKGRWKQNPENLETVEGELIYYTKSAPTSLVADPGKGIKDIEVKIDGRKVKPSEAGKDLKIENNKSFVRVKNPGLYQILEDGHGKREITLKPDKNTKLHRLTVDAETIKQ